MKRLIFKKQRVNFGRNTKVFVPTERKPIVIPFFPVSIAIIVLLLGLSAYLALRSDLFQIRRVEVESIGSSNIEECVLKDQIEDSLDVLGRSFFFLDIKKSKANIEGKLICLSDVQISKKFPDTLKFRARLRIPIAQVVFLETPPYLEATPTPLSTTSSLIEKATPSSSLPNLSQSKFFLVDKDSVLYKELNYQASLPVIYQKTMHKTGDKLSSSRESKVIDFINTFSSTDEKIQEIFLDKDDYFMASFSGNFRVLLPYHKKVEEITSSLQKILEEVKIEGKKLRILDLRFDKPIASFE